MNLTKCEIVRFSVKKKYPDRNRLKSDIRERGGRLGCTRFFKKRVQELLKDEYTRSEDMAFQKS